VQTTSRTTLLKATALTLAVVSLTINFGIADLVDGFAGIVDESRNQVLDAGWGALFGLVVPLGLVYASRMASAQRRDLPPADAVSNGLHHWTVLAALALVVALLALLAALRTPGWRIPAVGAAAASGAWAVSCLLVPSQAAGSAGHHWAWAVLVWGAAILAATLRPSRPVVVTPPAARAS
jgi:hypothetical protein